MSAAAKASASPPADARPLYYERPITAEDLEGRTLRELSLLRNTIYARVGNRFRRPWLAKHFEAKPWYEPKDEVDLAAIPQRDRDNARAIADHDAALTRQQLEQRRDEVLARRRARKPQLGDEVEISLLSQRLGTWLLADERNQTPTPLEDPSRLDELLTVEDLSTLSRRDLRILRNTVFARRGRRFESKVVRSYFATAGWYEPRADYDDGMLTGVDHKNVQLIESVEESLGGPLHENPNFKKGDWFFAA